MEENRQEEALDLSRKSHLHIPARFRKFMHQEHLLQNELKHMPPPVMCEICDPPATFQSRGALVNHRKKVHEVLPYLCDKSDCEDAFATYAGLEEHWNEKHNKCDGCNRIFHSPCGLTLHKKKCFVLEESGDGRNPGASGASSSLRRNEEADDPEIKMYNWPRMLGVLPFACTSTCGEVFATRDELEQHWREKHPEIDVPRTRGEFLAHP